MKKSFFGVEEAVVPDRFWNKAGKVELHFIITIGDQLAVITPSLQTLTQCEQMFGMIIPN
ncbi:MAG: hypothetical protein ACR2JB_18665 [Bryobacteraceae bacterium]